jgi:hypothetical protein
MTPDTGTSCATCCRWVMSHTTYISAVSPVLGGRDDLGVRVVHVYFKPSSSGSPVLALPLFTSYPDEPSWS